MAVSIGPVLEKDRIEMARRKTNEVIEFFSSSRKASKRIRGSNEWLLDWLVSCLSSPGLLCLSLSHSLACSHFAGTLHAPAPRALSFTLFLRYNNVTNTHSTQHTHTHTHALTQSHWFEWQRQRRLLLFRHTYWNNVYSTYDFSINIWFLRTFTWQFCWLFTNFSKETLLLPFFFDYDFG